MTTGSNILQPSNSVFKPLHRPNCISASKTGTFAFHVQLIFLGPKCVLGWMQLKSSSISTKLPSVHRQWKQYLVGPYIFIFTIWFDFYNQFRPMLWILKTIHALVRGYRHRMFPSSPATALMTHNSNVVQPWLIKGMNGLSRNWTGLKHCPHWWLYLVCCPPWEKCYFLQ